MKKEKTCLGIDTSGRMSSAALFYTESEKIVQRRQKLSTQGGPFGIFKNDPAQENVFALPDIVNELSAYEHAGLRAVGAAVCEDDIEKRAAHFSLGAALAKSIARMQGVPFYEFSHRDGLIASALYSLQRLDFLNYGFHCLYISDGGSAFLDIRPGGENLMKTRVLAKSCDIEVAELLAGVSDILGIHPDADIQLGELAKLSSESYLSAKASIPHFSGRDFHLSSILEKCKILLKEGIAKEDIAMFCMESIARTMASAIEICMDGEDIRDIVFAGEYSVNFPARDYMKNRFEQKLNLHFAAPDFLEDNAVGIAVLTNIKDRL